MSKSATLAGAQQSDRPAWASRRQLRYLSQAEILEELGPSNLSKAVILFLAALVIGSVAWAATAKIQQTSKAVGEIVPRGPIHTVQHLEGGIVQEVLVKEGELVEAGDTLVRLAPTTSTAELEAAQARRTSLSLKAERLRALAERRDPVFIVVSKRFSGMVRDQADILKQQNEARSQRFNVLEFKLAQERAELKALQSERDKLTGQIEILTQERDTQKRLLGKGLVSRLVYLGAEKQLRLTVGELAEVRDRLIKATQAIREAEAKLIEFEANSRGEALDEMGDVAAELAEVEERIVRLRDRVTRLEILAPVSGIVQELEADALGRVVTPGGLISKIVPVDGDLVAEAKLSPADVGQIRLGDIAKVKITTFDFARFGAIHGRVEKVSATTFKEPDGSVYYKVTILLESNHVGNDPNTNILLPGMVADVELLGEERTILRYLLRPVYQSLDVALTEK
ncbi:MAG: HlyD family type I secretion periplasmic adaptor subunit [Alphaproteobacteria bacterium]|nr:HlyD family type I secretion periplasmic adaptor subunit [Alphaproteobacteria bacterium]